MEHVVCHQRLSKMKKKNLVLQFWEADQPTVHLYKACTYLRDDEVLFDIHQTVHTACPIQEWWWWGAHMYS